MIAEYNNFIGTYRNVFPEGFCKHLISEFDRLQSNNAGRTRAQAENRTTLEKADYHVFLNHDYNGYFIDKETGNSVPVTRYIYEGVRQCFEHYADKFPNIGDMGVTSRVLKLQKTSPGEGYHIWHHEQGNGEAAKRVLSWMVYLNTLSPDEAGETEFLYQQRRIRPEENTMLIWPAAFTHVHRGNTVYGSNDKYIITGWFYLND